MIHDAALRDDEELLAGVNGMVMTAWRHERLLVDLRIAMADLERSRRRIAEAADIERARIEHDLHDGAQQRLIALRIKLSIAEELMNSDSAAGIAQIRALGPEVEEALEELRALAGGCTRRFSPSEGSRWRCVRWRTGCRWPFTSRRSA